MPRHPVLTDALLDAALGPEPRPDLKASSPRFFHSPVAEALTRAPCLSYDRRDQLQSRWVAQVLAATPPLPCHWLPLP